MYLFKWGTNMPTTTTMVHVRVDEEIKREAAETLEAMGLSISDAVRVLLKRVIADKKMPFEIKAPNAVTQAAIAEAETIMRSHRKRFSTASDLINDIKKTRSK